MERVRLLRRSVGDCVRPMIHPETPVKSLQKKSNITLYLLDCAMCGAGKKYIEFVTSIISKLDKATNITIDYYDGVNLYQITLFCIETEREERRKREKPWLCVTNML